MLTMSFTVPDPKPTSRRGKIAFADRPRPVRGGAEAWLRLQMAYDLAQARQHEAKIKVKRVLQPKLEASRSLK
jgi:hypothetical protein